MPDPSYLALRRADSELQLNIFVAKIFNSAEFLIPEHYLEVNSFKGLKRYAVVVG